MTVTMLRIRALQDFEVPNVGLFAEGSEYTMAEETARELQSRGVVELLETPKQEKKPNKAKIITS